MPIAPYIPFAIASLASMIGIPESTTAVGTPPVLALAPRPMLFPTPSTYTVTSMTSASHHSGPATVAWIGAYSTS